MQFLTDFADQAVVLPVAGTVLLCLALLGWRRGALAWGVGVAGVMVVTLVFKLVVLACGWLVPWTGLSSPSGHTATAAVVYGGLIGLFFRDHVRGTAVAALAGGAFALLFGFSRLALGVHTVPDVVVGAVIGVAGALVLRRLAAERPQRLAAPRLAAAALVAMVLFHGHRLEAESRIRWAALQIWPLSACLK